MNTQKNSSYKIYKDDPILLKSYVGKEVKITTEDNSSHTAILYTVDPVSESIVLLQPEEKSVSNNLKIILGYSIKNIEVTSKEKHIIPELFVSTPEIVLEPAITRKKDIVKQLLLDNRFPVVEHDNILWVEDIISIEPPYNPENCKCTNSIILSRLQKLLTQKDE